MRSYGIFTSIVLLLALSFVAHSQDDSDFSSTINWYYSACEEGMVVDLHGAMQAGYDVYFQGFDLFGGAGEPITALRRVAVNGDYSLSKTVNWMGAASRELGTPISVVFRIARENDPDDTLFQEASDDYLEECLEPGSTLEMDETPGEGDVVASSGVYLPDGGLLNPILYEAPEPLVQIGARPSENRNPDRSGTPGMIYAECAENPAAQPGLLYDTDELTLFWSWYARTAEQVQDHIINARYRVELLGYTVPGVKISEIKQIPNSSDWWVFYTANLGGKWEPGGYGVHMELRWANPISDGYADFGPGTENELIDGGCWFEVLRNPWDVAVIHENPSTPLVTYTDDGQRIEPD